MTNALKTQVVVAAALSAVVLGLVTLGATMKQPTNVSTATPELSAADIEATIQQISKEVKAENPTTEAEAETEVTTETDRLGEWAARAHDAEQAQQDRCWDQLEERGYGDAACY